MKIIHNGFIYEEVVNDGEYDIEKIKRDANYDYRNLDGVLYRITRNTDVEEMPINRIALTDENEFYEAQIEKYVEYIRNGGIIEPFPVQVSQLEYNLSGMISFLDDNKEMDDDIDHDFYDFTNDPNLGIQRYRFYEILTDKDEGEKFYKWCRL